MTKTPIVVVGAGGHAAACIDVIEQHGAYTIIGVMGLPAEVGSVVAGVPVIAGDDQLQRLRSQATAAVVAVGQIKSPAARIRLHDALRSSGFALPSIVSPRAYVSRHAHLGDGTIVMHGAVVNAGASVGRNCIINSLALIEHDVTIGDHCHIATHAAINSGVRVGRGTFVGSGALVRQGLTIGAECIIGMGQSVLVDCADGVTLPVPRR